MSMWHEIPDDDIDLDYSNGEVNILVSSDEWGNNYVTMTWEQIEELYNKISICSSSK